jgi:hypothetical protein
MNNLNDIISKTNDSPNIINNNSNFVVITYWWGRGNLNNNTARPCVSYYEDFFKRVVKICTNSIGSINKINPDKIISFKENLENIVDLREFTDMLKRKTNEYLMNIYSYAGIMENSSDKYQQALQFLEKLKLTGKTPQNYEFKNTEYIFIILYFISKEFIKINKQNIIDLYQNNSDIDDLKALFLNKDKNIDYKNKLNEFSKKNSSINDLIKKSLNIKNNYEAIQINKPNLTKYLNKIYEDPNIQNKSLNEILIQELRYLNPLKFEEMIENWKNQCSKNNCNYMAIEYPEFAKPGGYQMAINAKPLFIKKCLELCGGKSVLYIDGDMNIRKYPILFDLKDVDYMARGWWIDPRSSYKFEESIAYDPYNFETSGGTMFFSASEESRLLLDMWIIESDKTYQKGKADDRIISMLFNTKKMLLNMKIVQLPIEYLWLTLDYNDRLLESEVYDYNVSLMESSIIIDHPECLTSEDTATGSGASSDRTPKFYNFINYNLDPVSENYYEYLAFPDVKYTESLKDYLKYMSDVFYIDDGNQILYAKGFVEQGRSTSENEQPLYIYPFEKKYGDKNELSEIIIQRATNMNSKGLYKFNQSNNLAEIENVQFTKEEDPQKKDTVKVLALMYKLLNEGKDVLYKPSSTNNDIYQNFISNLDNKYKNIEFAFVPIFNGKSYSDIFRPLIDTNNCIYISHKSDFMKKFITIFESIDDISEFINNGFYQLLSSVRVAYLLKKKTPSKQNVMVGGNNIPEVYDYENEYLDAMDYIDNMQKMIQKGGYKKKHSKTIKKNKKHNKHNKKSRKHRK